MFRSIILALFLLVGAVTNAQNYKFGKVSKEEVSEKQHPLEENADAAVLYSYQRTYYDYNQVTGFKIISEYHQRIKIYNKEGFEWATKEISASQGNIDESVVSIKGITYNMENGKVEETKLDRDNIYEEDASKYRKVTKFTMPAIKEGSVVEFEYKITADKLSSSIDRIPLQYTIPINKLDVKVTVPEYLNYGVYNNPKAAFYVKVDQDSKPFKRSFSKSTRPSGSISSNQSMKTNRYSVEFMQNSYIVEEENIPSLIEENHVDYLENYAAYLDWELKYTKFPNSAIENYSNTWEGVAKSIYLDNGFERELRNSNYYDDELNALIGGTSDPQKKAALIFNFVKQKVKWNDYIGFVTENGLKNAYKDGSGNTGDINLLLVSMLKYAKLDANPVLVSTPSNGVPSFPTKSGFNYLLASVKINGKQLLLDATDQAAGMGELPKRARNWQGRLIREDGTSEWVSLQPNYYSKDGTVMNIQIAENSIKGKYINKLSGLHAKNYRMNHNSLDNAVNELSESLNTYEISNAEIKDFAKVGGEITNSYIFESTKAQEVIGDKIYFQPLFFETNTVNDFKAEKRTYPIFFDFPTQKHNLVNIMIPEDYEVVSVPESVIVKLKDNSGEFRYIVKQSGSYLIIDSEVNLSQTVYLAEDYDIIKKFFNNIVEKQNESIVLRKISTDGLEERAESGR
ncbi:DUF3857 domain-containing protein [Christiangramia sp. SM2212]|uniref:DUF3857 domain-containing protein n=1 Tax=Christiangramia sediminicola TaxID=3073267 RepID=A0ABU1EME0_9FLAO|nr:DUF3857 domain-containing protein [Christiangramia sp. SM2212]MDR5589521.1 DUF3857 domain-containing protein [Christiangramia sp. SM2212]